MVFNSDLFNNKVTLKRMCFSSVFLTFNPEPSVCSMNAPANNPILISDFSREQLLEIEEYLRSYAEKPYVIEVGENIYIVVPSFYPSTTACLAFRIDINPSVALRLINERDGFFVLSDKISISPARITKRIGDEKELFFELCDVIDNTLLYLDRYNLFFDDNVFVDGYCNQFVELAGLFGVRITELTVNNSLMGESMRSSFAIFTAYCVNMIMLARNESLDRSINAHLEFFEGTVRVNVEFKVDKPIKKSPQTDFLSVISSERRMFFEYSCEDGAFCSSFRPNLIDWAYFDIKQEFEKIDFLDYDE